MKRLPMLLFVAALVSLVGLDHVTFPDLPNWLNPEPEVMGKVTGHDVRGLVKLLASVTLLAIGTVVFISRTNTPLDRWLAYATLVFIVAYWLARHWQSVSREAAAVAFFV